MSSSGYNSYNSYYHEVTKLFGFTVIEWYIDVVAEWCVDVVAEWCIDVVDIMRHRFTAGNDYINTVSLLHE